MEKRNTSIQLLRVSACVLVFLVHFGQRAGLGGIVKTFTDFGRYGVQLFLLVSGFLAGKTFLDAPKANVLNYYKKRMIAILPLYYLVIAYYFISENILNQFVAVIPPDELGVGWFRYVFLLNGFLNSDTYFWSNLGITWTIPIFMCFYLIAPWILRRLKSVLSCVVTWLAVFVITRIMGRFYGCVIFDNLYLPFLGVVIYACAKMKHNMTASAIFSLLAICMIIVNKEAYAYVAIFSSIMLALIATDDIRLPKWLQSIVNILDKYSYTIYLMHGVVFCSILDRLNMIGVSKIIIAILAIIGTFVATFVVGKYIEKPIQSLLKRNFLKEKKDTE